IADKELRGHCEPPAAPRTESSLPRLTCGVWGTAPRTNTPPDGLRGPGPSNGWHTLVMAPGAVKRFFWQEVLYFTKLRRGGGGSPGSQKDASRGAAAHRDRNSGQERCPVGGEEHDEIGFFLG